MADHSFPSTLYEGDIPMATPIISLERVDVVEGDATFGPFATFRINLTEPSDEDITIQYRIRPGTAVATDFQTPGNVDEIFTVTIPAGATSITIEPEIRADNIDEVDEAFWLELFKPTNAVFDGGQNTLTSIGVIQDDDGGGANLSLFVSDATIKEGNSGQRIATFEVHLSQPATKAMSFAYKTVNGSAKGGNDYVAETGTVKFATGDKVATVEILITGDTKVEASEFFSLVVTPTADIKNGTAASTGLGTILEDDAATGALPVISIDRVDVVEGDATFGPFATFLINLSKPSDEDITIQYRVRPGTAVATDFQTPGNVDEIFTITIPAGDTSITIAPEIRADNIDEVDEAFWVELLNPTNAVLSGGENTLTSIGIIRDDDEGGAKLSLFVSDATVTEGDSGNRVATFEVHLSQPATKDLSFAYKTVSGSAKGGSDYAAKTGTIKFAAGQTVTTVDISVSGDTKAEASEFFSLVVTPTADIKNGTAASTGLGTIQDDDTGNGALPIISVERVDVVEGLATFGPFATFRVNLSKASDEDITIQYRVRPGTAVATDFQTPGNVDQVFTITIPAGDTSIMISPEIRADNVDEVDEAFWLELLNPTNAVLSGGEKTLTSVGIIRDDDGGGANLSLFVSNATVTEGSSGQKVATFEVHLSQPATKDLSFAYKTVNGSAKGGSDYVAETGTVKFAAGQTVTTIDVFVNGDRVLETNETFSVVLTPTVDIKNGTLGSTGVATIVNDDTIHEVIYGTSSSETLHGNDGNDTIFGRGGNDKLYGDLGNDILIGGTGADRLDGSSGLDRASYADATKGVQASLLSPAANTGDALGDTYFAIENLTGSKFADKLTGNTGNNLMTGGVGADQMTGGGGADKFVYASLSESTVASSGRDSIYDFTSNDRLDLRLLDANTKVAGNQAFSFIGTAAFSGSAGQLRYDKAASDTYVYADVNGDKTADFSIRLDDAITISQGFIYL
jgi:chitinase